MILVILETIRKGFQPSSFVPPRDSLCNAEFRAGVTSATPFKEDMEVYFFSWGSTEQCVSHDLSGLLL